MPAVITYTPGANAGIDTLGFSEEMVDELKGEIQNWINTSYTKWQEGARNFRSFTMRLVVNVEAVLMDPEESEVSIVLLEAD
jgi:hypothetical protein